MKFEKPSISNEDREKILEKIIQIRFSAFSNVTEFSFHLEKYNSIAFILTKSLNLIISDKMHDEIEEVEGIKYDDELSWGRYNIKSGSFEFYYDFLNDKEETKIPESIIKNKIKEFIKPYIKKS